MNLIVVWKKVVLEGDWPRYDGCEEPDEEGEGEANLEAVVVRPWRINVVLWGFRGGVVRGERQKQVTLKGPWE
jgi:hypothetical protein